MSENKKTQKKLDEKTADLWLSNTGQEPENDVEFNTDKVTDKNTDTDTHILLNKNEQYTERFELKMKPSQIRKLQKLSKKYNKSQAEILRTSFEFLISKLKNNK
ncbi:MAG: hypothetical protein ACOCRK_10780 [bacterium]